ncbi:MAG: hypothetical protein EHM21_05865 [Chloroflexi bacterium]|nr:MAG: hypothetical protein EHM21_05865 [Chloroflexota bacterium]
MAAVPPLKPLPGPPMPGGGEPAAVAAPAVPAPAAPVPAPAAAPIPLAASAPIETTCLAALTIPPNASTLAVSVILLRMPARDKSNPVAPHSQIRRITAESNPCWSNIELAESPALKTPPATTGSRAINRTALIHSERNQRACGSTLAIATGGASTARMNSTALEEANANSNPATARSDPRDKPIEISPPRKVRFVKPSTTEVAVVDRTNSIASSPVSPTTLPTIHQPRRMTRSRKGPAAMASAPAVTQSPTTRKPASSSPRSLPQ